MSTCRSCKAAIFWAETAEGKRIPLDERTVKGGNVELEGGVARVLPPDPDRIAHVSHFATCPQAPAWRKR